MINDPAIFFDTGPPRSYRFKRLHESRGRPQGCVFGRSTDFLSLSQALRVRNRRSFSIPCFRMRFQTVTRLMFKRRAAAD